MRREMLNMNRPLGVVVSMLSAIDWSATPRRFRSSAMSIRCRKLRASRWGPDPLAFENSVMPCSS